MPESHRLPETPRPTSIDRDRAAPPGVPRWLKVLALVVGILVLVLAAIMLIAGGDHGPDRHAARDQSGERIEQKATGVLPPAGPDSSALRFR